MRQALNIVCFIPHSMTESVTKNDENQRNWRLTLRLLFASCLVPLVCCLLFILFFPSVAGAEPVNLNADEINYDYQLKQLEAVGHVKIAYQDITVEAEKVIIDQDQNILLATGGVHVIKDNNDFKGDRFLYYLNTKQGLISPFDATITDSELKSPAILHAAETFLNGDDIRTKNTTFTGCDLANPHYHLSAKEIEYYPEDRIVFHDVWYWEGKIRLLYLPILFISLKEETDNSSVQLLRSDAEGWTLLLGYLYYLNDTTYGVIHSRLTEIGGNELGGRVYLQPSANNRFYVDYSLLDKRWLDYPNIDYLYGLGYEYWNSSTTNLIKRFDTSFSSWHKSDTSGLYHLENTYNLNFTGVSPYPDSFKINYFYNDAPDKMIESYDTEGTWSYNPDQTWRTSFYGRKSYKTEMNPSTKDFATSDKFQYTFSLTKNWPWSNLSLRYDETPLVSSNFSVTNTKPDIIYNIPKLKLPLVGELKLSTEYLRLEKIEYSPVDKLPSSQTGERLALDLQKSVDLRNYQLGNLGEITLNTDGLYRYRSFLVEDQSTKEKQLTNINGLTTRLNLTDKLNKYLRTDFRVGYTLARGVSNSFFGGSDNVLPGFSLENSWSWVSPTFTGSLSGKYNFQLKLADPLNLSLKWSPSITQSFALNTVYDWKNGPEQTNLNINYSPKDDWKLLLSLGYNFNKPDHPWTSQIFGADLVQPITDKWWLELSAHWDYFIGDFSKAVVGLGYHWHCRDLFAHYDYVNNQYWLQMSFNIYPEQKFRLIDSGDLVGYYLQMLY